MTSDNENSINLDHTLISSPSVWWRQKRQQLLTLVEKMDETPLYVYDASSLQSNANIIMSLKTHHKVIDRAYYAMKANSNPEILKIFEKSGLGFECVSLREVQRILDLFPQIDRKNRILFTPNFAPRKEYEQGLKLGITVTLDNTYPMLHWPEVFRNTEIWIRVDPGEGHGHCDKVKTAGVASKFGIPPSELDMLIERCEAVNCRIVGLHAHVGSGILDKPALWAETAEKLKSLTSKLPHVRSLDIGGGLGVPYRPEDKALDLGKLLEHLSVFKKENPQLELIIEPGRFLVAQAGVLLARVTQTKDKLRQKMYVGVDAGMNNLIRPTLYKSYHHIVNLSKLDAPNEIVADVVGSICETGDILGTDRPLPACVDGDVMLISTAGAYGYAMSSDYNLRHRGHEVLLPMDEHEELLVMRH